MPPDDRPELLEHGLVLLERGGHFVLGDPAVRIQALRLDAELFPLSFLDRFFGDSGEDFRVSGAEPRQAITADSLIPGLDRGTGIGFVGFYGFLGFSGFARLHGFWGVCQVRTGGSWHLQAGSG